jgi:hypothetical protein
MDAGGVRGPSDPAIGTTLTPGASVVTSMCPNHPVEVLRGLLGREFANDLPEGVNPVRRWCRDPQFFPGATGLLSELSWQDVSPGTVGAMDKLLPPPVHGAVIVGNYQATLRSYERILAEDIGGFPATWRILRQLLASISPREVFLTNAFVGLPDLIGDTAPFPTTAAFTLRCEQLLRTEIELFRPRLVVCLAVPAAKMLAAITPALRQWRPWPGYAEVNRRGALSVDRCSAAGVTFVAVAVRHPSAVLSRADRERDAGRIAAAGSASL